MVRLSWTEQFLTSYRGSCESVGPVSLDFSIFLVHEKIFFLIGILQKNIYKIYVWIIKHTNKVNTSEPTTESNRLLRML